MNDYSEIINLPYPRDDLKFLKNHLRMSMEERAKIFHPFAALRGHSEALDATVQKNQEFVEHEFTIEENFGV